MSSLICQKCHDDILLWLDPLNLPNARMKCRKCGHITTMKKFCKRHPIRDKIRDKITHIVFFIEYMVPLYWSRLTNTRYKKFDK